MSKYIVSKSDPLQSIIDRFLRYLKDGLKQDNVEIKDMVKNKDGSITYTFSFILPDEDSGEAIEYVLYMNGRPSEEDEGTVDMSFKYPNPKDLDVFKESIDTYTSVENTQKEILRKVQDFLDKTYDIDTLEYIPKKFSDKSYDTDKSDIGSSVSLRNNSKFARIIVANNKNIRVAANYNPSEVLVDIGNVIDSHDESNSVDTIDIVVDDDVIDFIPVKSNESSMYEFDYEYRCCSYYFMLSICWKFYIDMHHCYYTSCGPELDTIRQYSEQYRWNCQYMIDEISKWCISDGIRLDYPTCYLCSESSENNMTVPPSNNTYWSDFVDIFKADVETLLSTFNLYSINLPESYRSWTLDQSRNWNNELKYNILRHN